MPATKQNIIIEQGATFSLPLTVGTNYNTWTGRGKIVDAFGGNVLAEFAVATVAAGATTVSLTSAQTAALAPAIEPRDIDREVELGFYDIELVNATTGSTEIVRIREGKVTLSREATA